MGNLVRQVAQQDLNGAALDFSTSLPEKTDYTLESLSIDFSTAVTRTVVISKVYNAGADEVIILDDIVNPGMNTAVDIVFNDVIAFEDDSELRVQLGATAGACVAKISANFLEVFRT